jgi:hypothetical protein
MGFRKSVLLALIFGLLAASMPAALADGSVPKAVGILPPVGGNEESAVPTPGEHLVDDTLTEILGPPSCASDDNCLVNQPQKGSLLGLVLQPGSGCATTAEAPTKSGAIISARGKNVCPNPHEWVAAIPSIWRKRWWGWQEVADNNDGRKDSTTSG